MKLVEGNRPGWAALFSDDERHRFVLQRPVPEPDRKRAVSLRPLRDAVVLLPGAPVSAVAGRRLVSCGLNPSKADAFRNDNTVTLELTHAWLWHCTWYTKINAYAWRDTYPEDMWAARDAGSNIVGDGNDGAIRGAFDRLAADGGIALAAWGTLVDRERARRLHELACQHQVQWMCFGINKDGSPKHTLRQPYGTKLVPWSFR